jgi:hypothetical protein
LAVSVLEPAAEVDFEKEKLSMSRFTTGTVSQNNGGNGFNGSGTFTGNTAIGNSAFGIDSPGISSVIVSNALYSNGKNINAGSGSVVLNNVVQ